MLTSLAVIPARGGSKGIKDKNIRDVGGKPLIYWQINNGLKSKADKVVVSTDSEKIKDIASQWCDVIDRPAEISGDKSKTEDTLLHALDYHSADMVVLLQPTSPLTKPEQIDACIDLVEEGFDSSSCFVEDYGFFVDDMEQILKRPMRQDKEPRIRETGNCWVTKASILKETNNRLGGNFGIHIIPKEDAFEIDSEADWRIVEALIDREYFTHRERLPDVGTDPDGIDRKPTPEEFRAQHEGVIDYVNTICGRVVDVGCGEGFLRQCVTSEVYGVDPKVNGCLESHHYPDDYFDYAVLNHVIEHMNDPISELREVRRILKPNGKLIIETPDFESAVAQRFGANFRLLHDPTHVSLFGLLGLHRLLIDNLFEVEKIEYPYFDTGYFTEDNLLRLFDTTKVSPPCVGNVVTFYCRKK